MSADDLVSRLRDPKLSRLTYLSLAGRTADAIEARDAEIERLRAALGSLAARNSYDGRYVILCGDGSVASDDELMEGDVVLVDRETENGRSSP